MRECTSEKHLKTCAFRRGFFLFCFVLFLRTHIWASKKRIFAAGGKDTSATSLFLLGANTENNKSIRREKKSRPLRRGPTKGTAQYSPGCDYSPGVRTYPSLYFCPLASAAT